jgi:uncharacterized protein YegJ (DUF2314 family)
MIKKQIKIVFILIFICISCENRSIRKLDNGNDSDATYLFETDDSEMNNAILKARMTFNKFETAFKNPKKNQSNFTVKYAFDYDGGQEHLWLVDLKIDSNRYFGVIGNNPDLTKNVKYNQLVEFNPDSISDWKYFEGAKMVGGYTVKVIYSRMSDNDKEQFTKENGFKPE